jgi:DNA-binding MarR family transcriptional regulator
MNSTPESVLGQWQRVMNKVLFLGRKRAFRFRDVEFFPSEVHLMLVIKEEIDTNATRMAEELGVTKGAVSQALTRLERKGVLSKSKDPTMKNELSLAFTPFGVEVLDHYRRRAAVLFENPTALLQQLSDTERQAIQRFLASLEETFDGVPE